MALDFTKVKWILDFHDNADYVFIWAEFYWDLSPQFFGHITFFLGSVALFYFYTSFLCYMISVADGIGIPLTKADGFANYVSKVRMCACQRIFVRL